MVVRIDQVADLAVRRALAFKVANFQNVIADPVDLCLFGCCTVPAALQSRAPQTIG
jgi:hypothetical protein